MAKAIKKCRVCGKEYEYCRTFRSGSGFRYQDVACSPECGSIYLSAIIESRKAGSADNSNETADSKPESENTESEEII